MPAYLISYDNRAPRNYQPLYQLMGTLRAIRLTESLWMADLVGPASIVRDLVCGTLQPNDVVAVVELGRGSEWATANVTTAANGWLSANVTRSKIAA